MHKDDFIENPPRIKETTAQQVIVAAVWLWLIPAVNLLDSDTYGGAKIALMRWLPACQKESLGGPELLSFG